jgi:hypothetical protein
MVSLIVVAQTAFAAELTVGSRYYTKFLDRNTYDPAKWATTGNGVGIRSELELTLNGKVSDRAEMGARILTVWDPDGHAGYADWGGWYENWANLWMVRGMWLKFRPATIPTLNSVLLGSTDLGMYNAWTIGKIRWIDRDNARIIYADGTLGRATYGIGMLPMPKYMGPSWSTGPNPRRVWAYGANLTMPVNQAFNVKLNGSRIVALQQDPLSASDTVATKRYDNIVATADLLISPNPVYNISGLIGISRYSLNTILVTGPFQVWDPHLPYAALTSGGIALKLTAIANDPFGIGLTLNGEVFDVNQDFVSIMAARRETKVLLSEGHIRYGADVNGSTWKGDVGYTPAVGNFVDNGITDWNETNYQTCAGLRGITVIPEFRRGALGIKGELSSMSNDLNSQNVDTTKYWWSAAKVNQSTILAAVRADYLLPYGIGIFGKVKMVCWSDGVDTSIATDDLSMADTEIYAGASYQLTDEIGLTGGYKTLAYVDKGDGANQDTKTKDYGLGMIFAEVKANVGGADIGIACEKVDGKENVATTTVNDMRLKGTVEVKI